MLKKYQKLYMNKKEFIKKMELRPYQKESVESIFEEWKEHQSTLIVQATGTGKTIVFAEVVKRLNTLNKKILILF